MELAVLDLGSTTFHLQHFGVPPPPQAAGLRSADNTLGSVLDVKRSICMGAQVFVDGHIDRASWQRGLDAVSELLDLSDAHGFSERAVVATSAIRSARNGPDFVLELERRYACKVRVLEPHEEARLAYLGQLTSPVISGRRIAAIDLGGGSVELAVGAGPQPAHADSLPLGAVRMRVCEGAQVFGKPEAAALSQVLQEHLEAPLAQVRSHAPELVVFGSGSARAARKLLCRGSKLPGKTGPIDVQSFGAALTELLGSSQQELMELGVEPARAQTVLVSATIMLQLLTQLGFTYAFVSDRGLRDGVAFELQRRNESRDRAAEQLSAVL
jgi:exopolyphosphatase/guanosine-5'-triphosphate,3'-diphosphate pyrophosphatase